MPADQGNHNQITAPSPTCMESVNRITKLPVVESVYENATSIYSSIKDYNSVTNWTFTTAESTVNKAVEVGKPLTSPVVRNLEGPIKSVDDILCSGLDYIESKIPAVKQPPGEIYNSTKNYVSTTVTPVVENAYSYAEPALKTARDMVEPAYQQARTAVEPAVERARNIVEPLVQPAVEKATAMVGEFLHRDHNHEGETVECQDCQNVKDKKEHKAE